MQSAEDTAFMSSPLNYLVLLDSQLCHKKKKKQLWPSTALFHYSLKNFKLQMGVSDVSSLGDIPTLKLLYEEAWRELSAPAHKLLVPMIEGRILPSYFAILPKYEECLDTGKWKKYKCFYTFL